MIRLSIIVMFLLSLSSLGMTSRGSVLVVGAGAGGISAAQRLMANDYRVTVAEISNRAAGKCLTAPCRRGRGVTELGAIQVGIGYPIVNAYRKELGIKLRDYWSSQSLRYAERKNKAIYTDLSKEYWPLHDAKAIARESFVMRNALARFATYNEANFTNLSEDDEFAQPFEDWCDSLGLDHFKEDYRVWITSYGYGHLKDVPAYLPLSLINSSFGLVFLRRFDMNMRMLDVGYGGLLNKMIDHYGIDVHYQTSTKVLDRSDDGVTVSMTTEGEEPIIAHFDHLVLACGISCLGTVIDEPLRTKEEQALMDNLRVAPYDVVIADVPKLKKGGYVLPQMLDTPGHVSLISKNSAKGDDVILYIPRSGTPDENGRIQRPSEKTLTDVVAADMARFGFDNVEVLQIQYWDTYFEHWNQPKYYRMLNDMQGKNSTVYIGAMARFEIVERAMEHSHDMVDEHIIMAPKESKSMIGRVMSYTGALYDYFMADARDEMSSFEEE